MDKNYLVAAVASIVLIAAIGIGVRYLQTNQVGQVPSPAPLLSAAPSPSSAASPAATASPAAAPTVTFTDNGFTPAAITVKAGTTVTWVNQSSELMWIASNPHPAHTDYPGFDALRGYQNGKSYSFTFTRVGSWGYHNHLDPSTGGTVTVTQ